MTNTNYSRLKVLTNEILCNNNILEFLELYGILLTEGRQFEGLEGIQGLKEWLIGIKKAKEEESIRR